MFSMTRLRHRLAVVMAATLTAAAAGSASAATLVALTGDRTLIAIDTNAPKVTGVAYLSGIGGSLLGIDERPADGLLHGVVSDGTIVTINWRTGAAVFKSRLTQPLPAGFTASVDFNPVADRLRIVGSDGSNLRVNVDDGTVTPDAPLSLAQPNPFGGTAPRIVAAAYSNSRAGAKATLLWDIDVATNAIYLQLPPNAGTLNPSSDQLDISVGELGFDIQTDRTGANTPWLLTNNRLFRIGLIGGRTQDSRSVKGLKAVVRDIAVLGQGK